MSVYPCCGAERSWTRNSHREGCRYALPASVAAHPAGGTVKQTRRLTAIQGAETARAGVIQARSPSPVIGLLVVPDDGACPAHPSEEAFSCWPCAELGERE